MGIAATARDISGWLRAEARDLLAPVSARAVNQIFTGDSQDVEMLEQISYLQNEILRAPPEVVVPAAIFVFLVLIRLVLALPDCPRAVADDGLEAEARRWIDDRIDEHVNILAEAYGEAGMPAEEDELPPAFDMTVESFIAHVLLRELDSEGLDVDFRAAVREFMVLHRAEIYEDVTTRTRKHLTAA